MTLKPSPLSTTTYYDSEIKQYKTMHLYRRLEYCLINGLFTTSPEYINALAMIRKKYLDRNKISKS